MPNALVGKGVTLTGGQVLDTTTHRFRESPRLKPDASGEVRLTQAEIAEIRGGEDAEPSQDKLRRKGVIQPPGVPPGPAQA